MNIGVCRGCGLAVRSPTSPIKCPKGCVLPVILRPVKLQLRGGKTTKCGAACRNARSLYCDCECGGKNHGAKGHYVHATSARPKLAVRGARGDYGPHNAVFNAIGPYTVEGNVLEDRDHAIGQLTFGVYDNYLELSIIRIDPAFRGQGHARGVIAQLVKIADARSLTMLLSPTNQWGASLARLKALYKSFGFVENKGRRKDFAINASMYRLPHPAHGNARPGIPPEIAKALPEIVRVAQKQYDDWTVDEEGYDEEVGGGGICHLIADEIVEVLDKHDVMATTVSSSHEVHVYVVARVPTGVWQIDIRPHVYERGGGYSWTKIPGVTFDASDVEVDRLSSNPRDFKEYVEDWQSDDEPDDEDTAGHGDAGAVEAGWRASLSNPDDVDRIVLGDMDHIVERAMAAGAKAPLEYIGAGMTSVVLRSGAQSYKVARNLSPTRHANFEDEAEFFAACMRVAWVREHVAELRGFDAQRLVIVKAYVPRDPTMRLSQYEHSLWEVHKKIERLMLPHGWGAPEFKNDSYIPTARGAVLVDGTFAQRCGKTLLKYARDLLDGRRPWWTETPRDLGFALRMEVGRTLTPEEIAPLEARLSAQHGDTATARRKHGDTEREPLPSDVAEAFTALGRTQRGDPESAMNRVQEATGGGVMAYAVEHVGDLTHRMSHMAGWSGGGGDGYEYVHEKVKSCLRSLRNKYGFEREAHKNFENNARYQGVSIDKFMIGVNAALAGYVAEHRKIPVYNRAQWLARQAAIDLGQMKIRDTIWDLGALDDLLATKDKWRAAAFEYKRGADGELLQFPWPA